MKFEDKKFHFSKIVIILCIIFAILTCIIASFVPMAEGVAIALIAAGGGIASTAIVFNLRKSQVENTLKIYMSAYEQILELKHQYHDDDTEDEADDICNGLENKFLDKINQSFDETIDEATIPIEKQEIV